MNIFNYTLLSLIVFKINDIIAVRYASYILQQ